MSAPLLSLRAMLADPRMPAAQDAWNEGQLGELSELLHYRRRERAEDELSEPTTEVVSSLPEEL